MAAEKDRFLRNGGSRKPVFLKTRKNSPNVWTKGRKEMKKTETLILYEVGYLVDRHHKHFVPACKTFYDYIKAVKWASKHCVPNSFVIIVFECKPEGVLNCRVTEFRKW